jgi:hypothetical protein
MQKTVSFSIEDVAFDPDGVAETLNNACEHRRMKFYVRGVFQLDDHVYFTLIPLEDRPAEEYLIKPFEDVSADGIPATIKTRWESGFDTIGVICVHETCYGVFAKPCA